MSLFENIVLVDVIFPKNCLEFLFAIREHTVRWLVDIFIWTARFDKIILINELHVILAIGGHVIVNISCLPIELSIEGD